MPKTLFFLTSSYPFGTGETFIENEMPFLAEAFDKIIIISNDTQSEQTRAVPENVTLLRRPYEIPESEKWKALGSFLRIDFWKELWWVSKRKKLSKGILNTMLISLYKAEKTKAFLNDLAKEYSKDTIYAYSYWCNDNALALALWKKEQKEVKVLCRAHRWDLYEEFSTYNYLPYRELIAEKLDKLFIISDEGLKYWAVNFSEKKSLSVSRLGTVKHPSEKIELKKSVNLIVSCSTLICRKRVHLIIEALSLFNGEDQIQWVHFGDGPLREQLETKAEHLLDTKKNINWEFKGHASNKTVLEFYAQQQPDIFINVSETEGVPVSIMEAFSCSIPTIATDVGGVSEMVNEENGYLLPPNLKPINLAETIQQYLDLPEEEKERKRKAAYATWERKYNAEENYRGFVEELLKT